MKTWLVTAFSLFACLLLNGQNLELDTVIEKRISSYLEDVLSENATAAEAILATNKKWLELAADSSAYLKISSEIEYRLAVLEKDYLVVKKKMLQQYPKSNLAQAFTEKESQPIIRYKNLAILLNAFSIESDKSYEIKKRWIQELRFLDIQENETIADIGAGLGNTSFLIGLLGKENHLYITEISSNKISLLSERFNTLPELYSPYSFEIIKGLDKSTGLPDKCCDKIIIKNTFHHFKKKKKMLKSINKNLKDDGVLIIIEDFLEDVDDDHCRQLMPGYQIRAEIEKAGFNLIDLHKINGRTYLKYKSSNI